MKSFNQLLVELNDGHTLAALTGDFAELLQTVKSTGRGGSLTLKVKVSNASKGGSEVDKIIILAERKLELPKPEQPQDFFWLTDDAQPTRQHPRQHALDLREVPSTPTPEQAFAKTFTTPDADGVLTLKEAR